MHAKVERSAGLLNPFGKSYCYWQEGQSRNGEGGGKEKRKERNLKYWFIYTHNLSLK